ncbi:MAG: chorismate synthase [Bacteroidales bacterium]|jgi:chorismate synthase|nr:chorismate synthase [Bacteroidales bacterium]MDD4528956.1 chorismate synthase [Bacteroidales bacterium]MDD4830158.1 chorismate synthase [Bacteroidales bacterium]
MAGNSIGKLFKLTTFGESHSDFVGGVIDGCPSGLRIDLDFIEREVQRRKPLQEIYSTQRNEEDKIDFISGIENGISLGTPIAFIVRNNNIQKQDYNQLKDLFRPSHGDFTYFNKYGITSSSGGGRASARETLTRVVGGSVAKLLLGEYGIEVSGEIHSIGKWEYASHRDEIEKELEKIVENGDSLGGIVSCKVKNCPIGLGEPVFDKLSADLAKAIMSIPASKGFEIGDGFASTTKYGSEQLDNWNNDFTTKTNHSGGIQAGISNGMDINIKAGFKPIASLYRKVECIDKKGEVHNVENSGRHDRCFIPRAVVVVEAMVALVIADHLLRSFTNKLKR